MSVRTLQRRLEEEGATFRAVRDAVLQHRDAASRTAVALAADVAQRVGFADEDALAKAWKRWTGTTPSEHRRRGFTRND